MVRSREVNDPISGPHRGLRGPHRWASEGLTGGPLDTTQHVFTRPCHEIKGRKANTGQKALRSPKHSFETLADSRTKAPVFKRKHQNVKRERPPPISLGSTPKSSPTAPQREEQGEQAGGAARTDTGLSPGRVEGGETRESQENGERQEGGETRESQESGERQEGVETRERQESGERQEGGETRESQESGERQEGVETRERQESGERQEGVETRERQESGERQENGEIGERQERRAHGERDRRVERET
ncbi:hypothetical protein NHX12_029566 [Muraenolepis orangiensis]|uniref:Uncharacterized protein n=1 Tax=Muraenolepis orangiensis TaxID=630683 RepID=A0A9Q0EC94_9TELE|nr:hypothetical protein NHX12_029566 [Muraenolepis orangiensis]